ncbi:MAG: serine/threonine-protein kinase [Isosphaeraceae bacterium]|nr:serine/threonine-protein kinase [Isosphaeraceae bacterium]
MSQPETDRNLLFGVLALQDDLITERQFTDACSLWVLRRDKPLAEVLIDRGWINAANRVEVEQRLQRKLKKHGGDVRASLADVAGAEVRDVIRQVESPLIRQSLQMLPPAPSFVRVETLVRATGTEHRSRYTLSRLHAEGGLGKVWIARDTDLNREVALKEIRADRTIVPEASLRFLKEAQVTGQLEHPNIVPVYELGRRPEDNQPFYTMRFVRGQTLRDAIASYHEKRGAGKGDALGRQKLLSALVSVCQAIAYAHSRGVIHRDLKPENVVLGAFGEVVVLDWGLSKVVDQPEASEKDLQTVHLTQEASVKATFGIIGTPAYMAPEQAEGRHELVDVRTDVYGLGAILFEILTGHTPVEGNTVEEVLRRVTSRDARRARDVVADVPRALDAICFKALAKVRADRYQKAAELAEDVQRWMADEPVTAYRDPLSARLFRWARRHRPLVAGMAALLATAVVGLSVGLVFIDRERHRTEQQRQLAVTNAEQALHNLRLAQDAADGLLAEVADVDLADIPQMEAVRKRLLDKAQVGYREFLKQKGDDPLIRWGAGRSLVRLGDIQALLGEVAAAEQSYRQSLAILEGLAKGDPANADFRRDISRAEHGLGVLLKDANRFEPAEASLRGAIALRTELASGTKPRADDLQALADSRYQLGALLARRGAKGAADAEAYRAALKVQEGLVREYADRPDVRSRLARYRNNYGMLQRASGQAAEAEATFRETLTTLAPAIEGPGSLPGPRWQAGRSASNLGVLLLESKRDQEAGEMLRRAYDLLKTLAAEFPAVTQYQQDLSSAAYNLGLVAQRSGQTEQAVGSYREAAQLLEALCQRSPKTPSYRQKLVVAHVAINDALAASAPDEADRSLRKALEEQTVLLAEFPDVPEYQSEMGRSHFQLARLLLVRSKSAEAVLEAEAAENLYRKVLRTRPESEVILRSLMEALLVKTHGLIASGRLADAQRVAQQIPATLPDDSASYRHAAVLLVLCAEAAPKTAEGERLAEACRAGAVNVLSEAKRRDLLRSLNILDAPSLGPLRGRDDFEKLRKAVSEPARTG